MQAIGQISFSEIKWADKENGILYYEFFCGTKCGKGEFVSVRKVKGRWNIIETVQLWTA